MTNVMSGIEETPGESRLQRYLYCTYYSGALPRLAKT